MGFHCLAHKKLGAGASQPPETKPSREERQAFGPTRISGFTEGLSFTRGGVTGEKCNAGSFGVERFIFMARGKADDIPSALAAGFLRR